MADWLSPPPPPPAPYYPVDLRRRDEAESDILHVFGQAIFLFILLVCQNPEVFFVMARNMCTKCRESANEIFEQASTEFESRRQRRYERMAAWQQQQDEDDEEAADGHSISAPVAPAGRTPRVRVVLHAKLAKFQSRLDGLMASTGSTQLQRLQPSARTAHSPASMEQRSDTQHAVE